MANCLKDTVSKKSQPKTLSLENLDCVAEHLKPGDILFHYSVGEKTRNNKVVVGLNHIAYPLRKSNLPGIYPQHIVHCLVSLGGKTIAETNNTPKAPQIRIVNFCREHAFDEKKHHRYIVFRPKDSYFGLDVAKTAKRFASEFAKDKKHSGNKSDFSLWRGFLAFIKNDKLDEDAVKRFWKAAIYGNVLLEQETVPSKKHEYRPFFCSYFLAFCFQSVEGQRFLKEAGIKITRDAFETDGKIDSKKVSLYAKSLAKNPEYINKVSSAIFNINQKASTPIDVLNLVEHSDKFSHVLTLEGYR